MLDEVYHETVDGINVAFVVLAYGLGRTIELVGKGTMHWVMDGKISLVVVGAYLNNWYTTFVEFGAYLSNWHTTLLEVNAYYGSQNDMIEFGLTSMSYLDHHCHLPWAINK